ncbi:MAG TPA: haloacid dehalogenase type II [Thermoleophilaceae bacterium]|nr:haloacid dehalogenase type II [Thermoleophilaceae bacterium]
MPIAFDAFGTLFDLEALRAPLGEELYDAFYARLQPWTWFATAAGAYRPLPQLAEQALRSAAAANGADEQAAARHAERLTQLPLFPETEAALDSLSGERLAVLSNGTAGGLEELLANAGVRERFEYVLAADSVGRYKPAPEVYSLGPDAFGVPAQEVVLVSGNDWDTAGAKLAGLRSAWVSRGRPLAPVLGMEPDYVVDDLSGLAFAVGA